MMRQVQPGIALTDTGVLKRIRSGEELAAVRGSLRAAGLELWSSALTLHEVMQHPDDETRDRLLQRLAESTPNRHVLPMPATILRLSGEAILAGRHVFQSGSVDLDDLLNMAPEARGDLREAAETFTTRLESDLDAMVDRGRRLVRAHLRAHQTKEPWGSVSTFLNEQWLTTNQLDELLTGIWRGLELPGDPPIDLLLEHEAWALVCAGYGAAIYDRCIAPQSGRRVGAIDIQQLVYLGGGRQRLLLTEDKALHRIALAATARRFPLVGVLSWGDVVDQTVV